MDEFDSLIATICNGSTPQQARTAAEQRLMEVLCNLTTWKQYVGLLFQADDTVCFFLCIGFQKLVWRHWRNISMEDRVHLNQTIIQTLTNRPNIQLFAKSKLEQVLAAICANSCSIEPALGMLVDANHPHVSTGISTMRTVLELILSEDPQLFPEFRPAFQSAVNDILTPLTNLACSACNVALSSPNSPKEANSLTVTASLELLKVLITKLQIGSHVTSDVIDLLFNVAELGAVSNNNTTSASTCINAADANRAALSAIEVLTEIMGKKYLPPAKSSNSNSSGGDSSINMLKDMLLKTVNLLQKIRTAGNLIDSPIMVSLLEFIAVFAESHLPRCVSMSSLSQSDHAVLNPSLSSVDVNMNQAVVGFFEELVATTTSTQEPELLSRIVLVWNRVLYMGSVRDTLLTQSTLCVNMVSHLLQCCLCSSNSNMYDSIDELIEDVTIDTLVDPHMRSILSHICDYPRTNTTTTSSGANNNTNSNNNGNVLGAEEVNFVGTDLINNCRTLFTELSQSREVQQWLTTTVNQLITQNATVLSGPNSTNYNTSAVDLMLLVSLMPLLLLPVAQVIAQLTTLAAHFTEAQLHKRGKEFAALIVTCTQLAGRLIQSSGVVPISRVDAALVNELETLVKILLPCLSSLTASVCNNTTTSQYTNTVHTSMCILLLQLVTVNIDILDLENAQCASIKEAIVNLLDDQHTGLLNKDEVPIENLVLLMCIQDLLQPHTVANTIVTQCVEMVNMVDSASAQGYATLDPSVVGRLTKITAALDGLARNHALSRPARRQNLIQHFAPLQTFLGKYVTTLFRLLLHNYNVELSSLNSNTSKNGCNSVQVGYLTRLVISLSCALLQSLGKKSFGKAAADVLNIAVDFAESISSLSGGGNRLLSPAGLPLTKQLLELTQVLAESTAASSPTVNLQASSTYRLLCFIAQGLNDDRVCAELLQPTLKAGVTAVRCYWQKTHKNLPFLAAIAQNNGVPAPGMGSGESIPDIDGENVRPIAVLLTQLCVGSLSPTVSPQDTLTALEGLILLSEQHKLFNMNWFQNQCWASLLTPCLKAVLLRIHNMHRPQLEQVLIALASAGEASYLAMARTSIDSMQLQHQLQQQQLNTSHHNSPHGNTLSPALTHNNNAISATSSGGSSPQGIDVGEILYAKYQEFWVSIGNEMIGLAAQYQCGEMASHTLYSVLNSYQAAAVAAGQFSAGITNISAHSSSRGPFLIDMRIFIDKIISPVSSEIARLH